MRFNEFKVNEDVYDDLMAVVNLSKANNPTAAAGAANATGQERSGPAGAGLQNFKSQGGQVDPNLMKNYLASKGLSVNQIAGLLVNIKWESHFKPGAFVASDNKQGPSGGLFGFHDPKFDGRGNFSDMVRACGGPDKWQTNWQGQLDVALNSGPGKQYVTMNFPTPAAAAQWWVINYEKPANTQGQAVARAKEAHRYA
jgi:hypothetical protein